MKDLLGLRKKDIDKLIEYNFISSEKEAIRNGNFSDGSPEYMVCFDTSDQQYRAYMLIFNNELIEDKED